jgi:hypothetical protein
MKLFGRTLKAYQVHNKLNLNNIFKSYLGYHDLKGLCNSPDYFVRLLKKLFAMIRQLNLPMFFVIFTCTKRLWDPLIKALHTLHASKLYLPNKIKDLQFVHIAKFIQINSITCKVFFYGKFSPPKRQKKRLVNLAKDFLRIFKNICHILRKNN